MPNDLPTEQAIHAALKRLGDRLVEAGYANSFAFDASRGIMALDWNERGLVLKSSLLDIFKVQNQPLQPPAIQEAIALLYLILLPKPRK